MKRFLCAAAVVTALLLGLAAARVRQPASAVAHAAQLADARIVTAPLGGVVTAVLVEQGDAVRKGQLIVRLDAGELDHRLSRAQAALERTPPEMVDSAARVLSRISPQTWRRLISTEPGLQAAEQEYADAVAAAGSDPSPDAKQRIDRAAARRMAAQRRIGGLNVGSLTEIAALFRESAGDVAWLAQKRSAAEVCAPADGVVEIIDLHTGDSIPPAGRVALVAVRSE